MKPSSQGSVAARLWWVGAALLVLLFLAPLTAWHLGGDGVSAGRWGAAQKVSFHRELDRVYRTAGWDMAFSLGVTTDPTWGFDIVQLERQRPPLAWFCGPLVDEGPAVVGVRYLVGGWYVSERTFAGRPFAWNHGTGALLVSGRTEDDPLGPLESEPAARLLGRAPTEADLIHWDDVFPDSPPLRVATWTCNDLHRTWLGSWGGWLALGGLGWIVARVRKSRRQRTKPGTDGIAA